MTGLDTHNATGLVGRRSNSVGEATGSGGYRPGRQDTMTDRDLTRHLGHQSESCSGKIRWVIYVIVDERQVGTYLGIAVSRLAIYRIIWSCLGFKGREKMKGGRTRNRSRSAVPSSFGFPNYFEPNYRFVSEESDRLTKYPIFPPDLMAMHLPIISVHWFNAVADLLLSTRHPAYKGPHHQRQMGPGRLGE